MTPRLYDIVVIGATGYSGKLVSKYLATVAAQRGITFAVAGRSGEKLDLLVKELNSPCRVATIVADTSDTARLDELCQQTTVVIACAGPFDLVGMNVVAACVRNSTHYVDITGEFQYVRKMIETYDEVARAKGVMLVPCCGFDCVPSEVGNWVVHEYAEKQGLGKVKEVKAYFSANGAPSGGTMASIANVFATIERKDMHPASLNPQKPKAAGGTPSPRYPMTKGVSFNALMNKYQGPYIMAGINERVVRRGNALSGRDNSSYVEASVGSLMNVVIMTAVFYLMGITMMIPFVRNLLVKYAFPAQGSGPSESQLAKGKFRGDFFGVTEAGATVAVTVKDNRDCYVVTGVFAGICGMIASRKQQGSVQGGVLTASVAFGQDLVDMLRDAGVTITADSK